MKNNFIAITYLIYIVLYEILIIGGCGYVVFVLGHSENWWWLAVLFSMGAYKPHTWHELLTGKLNSENAETK